MPARCSICQDTFTDASRAMTTLCGHLYCAECATRQFASRAMCAICRRGPYKLDALIRLYPDYEPDSEPQPSPPPSAQGLGGEPESTVLHSAAGRGRGRGRVPASLTPAFNGHEPQRLANNTPSLPMSFRRAQTLGRILALYGRGNGDHVNRVRRTVSVSRAPATPIMGFPGAQPAGRISTVHGRGTSRGRGTSVRGTVSRAPTTPITSFLTALSPGRTSTVRGRGISRGRGSSVHGTVSRAPTTPITSFLAALSPGRTSTVRGRGISRGRGTVSRAPTTPVRGLSLMPNRRRQSIWI